MKISVIIPSYNHAKYVKDAIESVLSQNYKDLELIVIDDGSSDKSPEILKELQSEYGFDLVLKENEGICKTLNLGIDRAQGELITILASDDIMTSNRIQEQVEFMKLHPEVDIAAGEVVTIDENGRKLKRRKVPAKGPLSFKDMVKGNQIFAPTAVFRRSVYDRFGLYPESFAMEDYYMWLNVLKKNGVIFNTDKLWAYYRLFPAVNSEKKFNWYYKGFRQILSQYLPREDVVAELERHHLSYCAKMTLLNGKNFTSKHNFKELGSFHKLILKLLAHAPKGLRLFLLNKLLKS